MCTNSCCKYSEYSIIIYLLLKLGAKSLKAVPNWKLYAKVNIRLNTAKFSDFVDASNEEVTEDMWIPSACSLKCVFTNQLGG